MAKRRVVSEREKNIIADLISEYGIESIADLHEAFKDLFGGTIQGMLEAEFDNHMGYEKYEQTEDGGKNNYRNGTGTKTLKSTYGEIPIHAPEIGMDSLSSKLFQKGKGIFLR